MIPATIDVDHFLMAVVGGTAELTLPAFNVRLDTAARFTHGQPTVGVVAFGAAEHEFGLNEG
jgi:hypothetical protein